MRFQQSITVPEAKMWIYFISSKLLLVQHITDVTRHRAIMLHAILQCVKGHTRGLLYPHLITELYRGVGIEFDVDELICPPKGMRTRKIVDFQSPWRTLTYTIKGTTKGVTLISINLMTEDMAQRIVAYLAYNPVWNYEYGKVMCHLAV
ncbi:hypothetical protein V6Z11_D12G083300 [Gossypium hirsutum]